MLFFLFWPGEPAPFFLGESVERSSLLLSGMPGARGVLLLSPLLLRKKIMVFLFARVS